MPEKHIEIQGLSKSFGEIKAVNDLSFSVFQGDIMGFLGPNGAGKSTTIRMILSLIKPDCGEIKIFGMSMPLQRIKILSRIGAMVEEPRFYEFLTAYKNLEILSKTSIGYADKKKIEEILELTGLLHRKSSKVKTFSHGMKQRLGLAQALIHDPDILILDEPGNGLDPRGMVDMRELIIRINKEFGKTILISSHILKEIELISNRMIIVDHGHKIIEGEVADLLNSGDIKVKIETSNIEEAIEILAKNDIENFKMSDTSITVMVKKTYIPELTALLVKNDIKIYGIDPVKTLEEYFLDIT